MPLSHRRAAHRSALAAVLAAGLAAAVLFARSGPRDQPAPPAGEARAAAGEAEPPPELYACAVRSAARRVVARGVIAGRVSVAEAAAAFAALNALPPKTA